MDHTEKRKTSFNDLPPELMELIAMNLYLPDYLSFRKFCRRTWLWFGCLALIPILEDIQTFENEIPKTRCEDCHYISRGHILSYAYRKNGSIPKIDDLVHSGASLEHIPCGDMIESAACSPNYKALLNWLIDHGASFQDVQGGIDRLCYEVFKQGDFEKFRWLFSEGASLKHMPRGDMIQRAARSPNYKLLLNWLIDHGASFQEFHGGIDRLCCEAFEQGDFEKFRWLFSKEASLDVLAGVVFDFYGDHRPRTLLARRYHLSTLKKALREGATPSGSHEAMTAELKLRRRNGLSDGWRRPISDQAAEELCCPAHPEPVFNYITLTAP